MYPDYKAAFRCEADGFITAAATPESQSSIFLFLGSRDIKKRALAYGLPADANAYTARPVKQVCDGAGDEKLITRCNRLWLTVHTCVSQVVLIGAGYMGMGIAHLLVASLFPVFLLDLNADQLGVAVAHIRAELAKDVKCSMLC